MKNVICCLFVSCCLIFTACQETIQTVKVESVVYTKESHSFARPDLAVVKHLSWNAKVDFNRKQIIACANWSIENSTNASEIIFDTRDLHIDSITLDNSIVPVNYRWISATQTFMGTGLAIQIKPSTKTIHIYYITSPDAAALQWLHPEQTAGKKEKFLFTQSEAILARTWIPCQDAPGIRFTYDATVQVPKNLLALMSATDNPQSLHENGEYVFHQTHPIPSYLLALAIGDIGFKSMDQRCGVYAEKVVLDKAAYEFADMGSMVNTAESLYGKYAWGRYDVLVLPPSFPFGGMENPCLTFATPTIITGNRDLVTLIAHELAHSWSGNLITNATWDDFWLNEGFTVYFEQRIMEKMYGREYSEMLAAINVRDLNLALIDFGDTSKDTRLKLDLLNRDPDDGMTDIAYDKGYLFLRLMEETAGRKKWDAFLKNYFTVYQFQSMTTEKFLNVLNKEFISKDSLRYQKLGIENWIYKAGLPANAPVVVSTKFAEVDKVVANFLHTENSEALVFDTVISKKWSTHEWIRFLNGLPASTSLAQMEQLDKCFHFTGSGNNEIAVIWYQLAIQTNYKKAGPSMEDFLIHVGRRKFLTPLYTELCKTKSGKVWAQKIYQNARPNYHSVAQTTIDELLGTM